MKNSRVLEKNKLLIMKGGALGDVLVSTAAIYEVINSGVFSDIEICGPSFLPDFFSPVIWPKISKIWVIDKNYKFVEEYLPCADDSFNNSLNTEGHRPLFWKATGRRQTYWSLLHNDFDSIINLKYESGRFIFPAFVAGIRTRIGSAPWYLQFLYTDCAQWLGLDPLIHERDRNFQVISAYKRFQEFQKKWSGGDLQKKGLPILWEKQKEVLKKYNLESGYILINPTCSERYKAWQPQKFHALLKALLSSNVVKYSNTQHDKNNQNEKSLQKTKVVLVGTKNETVWLEEVRQDLPIQIVQPDSIRDLIQVVAHAEILISNASSMHYIATAQDTPALVLYGAALPEVWGVLGEYSRSVHGQYHESIQDRKIAETTAFQNLSETEVIETILLYMKELGIGNH